MFQVAIAGSGAMGHIHANAFKTIPDVRLAYIVDVNPQRGQELAREMNCEFRTGLDQLKRGDVDIVDICVPTNFHLPVIQQATRICNNIICEKPLAIEDGDVDSIQALVEKENIRFMVAHVVRFWGCYLEAKKLLEQGAIGKLNSVVCMRRQKKPEWSDDNWLMKTQLSGGLIYDLSIHDIDYISWLLGKPEYVFGDLKHDADGSEMHVKAEIVYPECTATVFGSWGMPVGFRGGDITFSLEMIGDKGRIYCDQTGIISWSDRKITREWKADTMDPYREELQYFVSCCKDESAPSIADIHSIRDALTISHAIKQSISQQQVITMSAHESERSSD